ncbi:UNVERIFIED_CONTAM: hypothetical protein FKN15_005966 [Acipenser sinensis]
MPTVPLLFRSRSRWSGAPLRCVELYNCVTLLSLSFKTGLSYVWEGEHDTSRFLVSGS